MSYCRFCNTYRDLSDCVTAMEDYIEYAEANEISENELSWAQKSITYVKSLLTLTKRWKKSLICKTRRK